MIFIIKQDLKQNSKILKKIGSQMTVMIKLMDGMMTLKIQDGMHMIKKINMQMKYQQMPTKELYQLKLLTEFMEN